MRENLKAEIGKAEMKLVLAFFLLSAFNSQLFAGTDSINYNTADGHIKQGSPSGAGAASKPFNGADVSFTRLPHAVKLHVDGAGSVLTTGTKNPTKLPYGGTLLGWLLIAKPSGSVTVDVLRSANGAGLPVTSMIGGGTKPALSSAVENSSTSFTSWTSTTLNEKDNLALSLSGISSVTYLELTLYFK